jgi:hypothetical protein
LAGAAVASSLPTTPRIGAPWVIRRDDLEKPAVRDALQSGQTDR